MIKMGSIHPVSVTATLMAEGNNSQSMVDLKLWYSRGICNLLSLGRVSMTKQK